MTKGQQFANDMRHFLAIGTRTRRNRRGLDLHAEIADWIRVAAMECGTLDPSQEDAFRVAFDAACCWFKWIKAGRASHYVTDYINSLSPYRFCAFLGDMIDAEIKTTSQGGRFFDQLRTSLTAQAA